MKKTIKLLVMMLLGFNVVGLYGMFKSYHKVVDWSDEDNEKDMISASKKVDELDESYEEDKKPTLNFYKQMLDERSHFGKDFLKKLNFSERYSRDLWNPKIAHPPYREDEFILLFSERNSLAKNSYNGISRKFSVYIEDFIKKKKYSYFDLQKFLNGLERRAAGDSDKYSIESDIIREIDLDTGKTVKRDKALIGLRMLVYGHFIRAVKQKMQKMREDYEKRVQEEKTRAEQKRWTGLLKQDSKRRRAALERRKREKEREKEEEKRRLREAKMDEERRAAESIEREKREEEERAKKQKFITLANRVLSDSKFEEKFPEFDLVKLKNLKKGITFWIEKQKEGIKNYKEWNDFPDPMMVEEMQGLVLEFEGELEKVNERIADIESGARLKKAPLPPTKEELEKKRREKERKIREERRMNFFLKPIKPIKPIKTTDEIRKAREEKQALKRLEEQRAEEARRLAEQMKLKKKKELEEELKRKQKLISWAEGIVNDKEFEKRFLKANKGKLIDLKAAVEYWIESLEEKVRWEEEDGQILRAEGFRGNIDFLSKLIERINARIEELNEKSERVVEEEVVVVRQPEETLEEKEFKRWGEIDKREEEEKLEAEKRKQQKYKELLAKKEKLLALREKMLRAFRAKFEKEVGDLVLNARTGDMVFEHEKQFLEKIKKGSFSKRDIGCLKKAAENFIKIEQEKIAQTTLNTFEEQEHMNIIAKYEAVIRFLDSVKPSEEEEVVIVRENK